MSIVLGVVRGFDFFAFHLLFGSVFFSTFISSLDFRRVRVLLFLTALSGAAWTYLVAADMTESWQPQDIWNAMASTTFGHLWCLRVLTLLALFCVPVWNRKKGQITLLIILTGLSLISVLTGHAAVQEKQWSLHIAITWLHSVMISVWSGGLFSLIFWLKNYSGSFESCYKVIRKFSHYAITSTLGLTLTGVIMSYWAGVSFLHPWSTEYGKLVFIKFLFFTFAMIAAAINQFVHLKKVNSANQAMFTQRIRREVCIELALVAVIFFVAGFLTRTYT